jgi:hypothetical protein
MAHVVTEHKLAVGGCGIVVVREAEPGYCLGTLDIAGTPHHLELIQVVQDSQTGEQGAMGAGLTYEQWSLNQQRLDDMQFLSDDGIYQTVELDGREWVCRLFPHCT